MREGSIKMCAMQIIICQVFFLIFSLKKKIQKSLKVGQSAFIPVLFSLRDTFPNQVIENKWELWEQRKTKRKTKNPEPNLPGAGRPLL